MTFNSVIFLFFFLPVVVLGSVLLQKAPLARKIWLLLSGFVFYGWCNTRILAFLLVYGLAHYVCGCLLQRYKQQKSTQKALLIVGITLNLSCLFAVKYLNYTISLGNQLFGTQIPAVTNLIMPLGISFLCFTMIAYLVDVYQEKTPALNSPIDFFLYLSFFPKVSQGPITRHGEMTPFSLTVTTFSDGLRRFIVGLGKKVLIADVLGGAVDTVFANLSLGISSASAWMGILCYTLQIFYDFSGYTDMAIGIGKMLGYPLPENFDFPYLSRSVSEFWRRWHMTLGAWFKEYIYFPLGGSRKGLLRTILNLSVVWLFTGIWHGAATHYVLWGAYFGILVIIEKLIGKSTWYQKIPAFAKWAATFFLVMIGWVIFRAGSVSEAFAYCKTLFSHANAGIYGFGYYFDNAVYLAAGFGILLTLPRPKKYLAQLSDRPAVLFIKSVWLLGILLISVFFMLNSTYNSFIYFQF